MDVLLATAAGLLALAGSVAVLRSFGSRYRVGRLLAAAPRVTVAEAVELAHRGHAPYVRVDGRIDSEAEFEDVEHRPLVLRRTRLQVRRGGRWVDFETNHEVVPFEIAEGLDSIAIDGANLNDGLVVVPRETVGTVGDLADRAPDELDDALPARVVVQQLSSVEHATALGIPGLDANGLPALGPGLGRPLVVSTLEGPEAMRVLAGGTTGRPRAAAVLLAIAALLLITAVVLFVVPGDVLGASPSPPAISGSDTRSPGQGPGFVGAIGPAFLAVIGIAAVTIALTLAFVRVTGGPKPLEPPRRR